MNKAEYIKLCNKHSTLILQRIICPYCGYVYDKDKSIEYGIGYNCEDTLIISCLKCNKKIEVNSTVVEPRFYTCKAEIYNE